MLDNAFQRFPCQVQSVKTRIAVFKFDKNAESLFIMAESAVRFHGSRQPVFPRMAKTGMAEIMSQGDRFRQIFVKAQSAADRARNLRDFQRMRQARTVIIAFAFDKHLSLVAHFAESA
jgi:hypothetical protein